ncbi:lipocalin family protein [Halobacteriovorax sp.]|uniref:lipocalin family protein n=1 Tax=Halobacteriovorax sp. TaxID=2020862 RepID=UPI003AF1E9AF
MKLFTLISFLFLVSCSSTTYNKTVDYVDINRFMGKWYVLSARATFLEEGAHNSLEIYKWNKEKQRIDIDFSFNEDSFEGELKEIPQKAWIINKETNAHWEVSPFWPLYFDYLVIAMDPDYQWVAIGVPDEKYLWIMARDWRNPEPIIKKVTREVSELGYSVKDLVDVNHKWD